MIFGIISLLLIILSIKTSPERNILYTSSALIFLIAMLGFSLAFSNSAPSITSNTLLTANTVYNSSYSTEYVLSSNGAYTLSLYYNVSNTMIIRNITTGIIPTGYNYKVNRTGYYSVIVP